MRNKNFLKLINIRLLWKKKYI